MKVCIFGQATGGNASIWFDFFNNYENKDIEITYLCRTIKTLDAKFKIIPIYGSGSLPIFIKKVLSYLVSNFLIGIVFNLANKLNSFDSLILQGNYSPELNLKILKNFKGKVLLNIYGSDFYRNYLLSNNKQYRDKFIEVLERADCIVCNWSTTQKDFLKEFPHFESKCSTALWGVSKDWLSNESKSLNNEIFLSARGLYKYNNIDKVVEAFCRAFKGDLDKQLYIVNGYGNDDETIKKVQSIIEKNGMHDQIFLRVNEWISESELRELYKKSKYNICFGSTDQLTISIVYGFLSNCINVLSPLDNYKYLNNLGFRTHKIINKISVKSLEEYFLSLENSRTQKNEDLLLDRAVALELFNHENTFNHHIEQLKK